MLFKPSEQTEYMYKYMIGFLFLNFAIYSDIHYCISENLMNYLPYIKFISILVIIYVYTLDLSSCILLAVSFSIFSNIIYIKKYLREFFLDYGIETMLSESEYQDPNSISLSEFEKMKNHCMKTNWEDETCEMIKEKLINLCSDRYTKPLKSWDTIKSGYKIDNKNIDIPCKELKDILVGKEKFKTILERI